MSPLDQAREWVESEKPDKAEIQQSVDNLCHQLARPPEGTTTEEIHKAISFLMGLMGAAAEELVLPDTPSRAVLDYSPLVSFDEPVAGISPDEADSRKKRFQELRDALKDASIPF